MYTREGRGRAIYTRRVVRRVYHLVYTSQYTLLGTPPLDVTRADTPPGYAAGSEEASGLNVEKEPGCGGERATLRREV